MISGSNTRRAIPKTKYYIHINLLKYALPPFTNALSPDIITFVPSEKPEHGALAQLARALHWQCRGQGFESPMLHHSPSENTVFGRIFYTFQPNITRPEPEIAKLERMKSDETEASAPAVGNRRNLPSAARKQKDVKNNKMTRFAGFCAAKRDFLYTLTE